MYLMSGSAIWIDVFVMYIADFGFNEQNWRMLYSAGLYTDLIYIDSDPRGREEPWSQRSLDSCLPLYERVCTESNGIEMRINWLCPCGPAPPPPPAAAWRLLIVYRLLEFLRFLYCFKILSFNSKYKILGNHFSWLSMKVKH